MQQYVHLVTNSGASLPTDVWYPSNQTVRPQRAQQAATGVSYLFGGGHLAVHPGGVLQVDGERVVDFRDGAQLFVNPNAGPASFSSARATPTARSSTWKRSKARAPDRLAGLHAGVGQSRAPVQRLQQRSRSSTAASTFPTTYDRRHNLTAVLHLQQVSRRVSAHRRSFVYSSGSPYHARHRPLRRFRTSGGSTSIFVRTGLPRPQPVPPDSLPPPRSGGGVQAAPPPRRKSDLTLQHLQRLQPPQRLLRLLRRPQKHHPQRATQPVAKQVSLFPLIPAITYNFHF